MINELRYCSCQEILIYCLSLRGVYIKRKNNSRRPGHWFASAYVTPTCAPAGAAWEFDEETEGQLEGRGAGRTITDKEA